MAKLPPTQIQFLQLVIAASKDHPDGWVPEPYQVKNGSRHRFSSRIRHELESMGVLEARQLDEIWCYRIHPDLSPKAAAILKEVQDLHLHPAPHEVLLSVADAAVAWWAMKRPVTMNLDQHKQNPTINCQSSDEEVLAIAVVKWLSIGG